MAQNVTQQIDLEALVAVLVLGLDFDALQYKPQSVVCRTLQFCGYVQERRLVSLIEYSSLTFDQTSHLLSMHANTTGSCRSLLSRKKSSWDNERACTVVTARTVVGSGIPSTSEMSPTADFWPREATGS